MTNNLLQHAWVVPFGVIVVVVALSMAHWLMELMKPVARLLSCVPWRVRVCADVLMAMALGLTSSVLYLNK